MNLKHEFTYVVTLKPPSPQAEDELRVCKSADIDASLITIQNWWFQ